MSPQFSITISLIYIVLITIRTLRWLSIWQQKEYRLDRVLSFFYSRDGKKELLRFVNLPRSLNNLRRPKPTAKAIFVFINTILLTYFFVLSNSFPVILLWVLVYLFLPLIVLTATAPASLITWLAILYYQKIATDKIKSSKPLIIGITGSYGKTTTKILLAQILKTKHSVWHSPKSYNTPLSLPKAISNSYRGEKIVLIEFAAYKQGEIARLSSLFPPQHAIITGITHQHAGLFGNLNNIIKAKSELLDSLKPSSTVVYNDADPNVSKMLKPFKSLKTVKASTANTSSPKLSKTGELSFAFNKQRIKSRLIGTHYLPNIQLAISMAQKLGVPDASIKKSLETFKPFEEFIQVKKTKQGALLILDGKTSNPKGFEAAVNLAADLKTHYTSVSLLTSGIIDLGQESDSIHQHLGGLAQKVFNTLIHTSSTGQSALQKTLGKKYHQVKSVQDFRKMLEQLNQPEHLILVEGRFPPHLSKLIENLYS